jgi:hypothetical protein
VYQDGGGVGYSATVQCTEDLTAPDNQTWKTNLANWIPTQFGDNYLVKVYVDTTGSTTPQTTGTRLFQAGSGSDDTWFFDYQAGILNFNGAAIPSVIVGGVSGKSVFVVGYRYVGVFGVGGDLGNIIFSNNTISSSSANATIVIQPTGTGVVTIDTTTGLVLPTGNTVQRPGSPSTGTLRFNTNSTDVEVWDGTQWTNVGGTALITNQYITGDGSNTVFTLNQTTTSASIIVSTNGVVQFPDVAYTVAGNLITFAEAPVSTDVIDIRFTTILNTINAVTNASGQELTITVPGVVNITNTHSLQLPTYTVSQASALGNVAAGQVIYVSNGDSGNPCLAVYSGGAWKRVALGATIST